jgi:hypothetical protein
MKEKSMNVVGVIGVSTFPSSNKRKCMPRRQYNFFLYTLNIGSLKK